MNPNLQRIMMAANKGVFSPLDIPDVRLWLDASDASTLWADTAGTTPATSSVARWDDKSGNAHNATQSTAGSQPTTATRTINGLNVLDYVSDSLQLPTAFRNSVNASDVTMFIVFQTDVGSAKQVLLTSLLNTGRTAFGLLVNSANLLTFLHGDNGPTEDNAAKVACTPTNVNLAVGRSTGTTQYVNNGATAVSNTNGTATIGLGGATSIGSYNNNAGDRLNGVIAEIIIYTRSLTDSEVNKVANYLSSKWGASWANI
jgi:hypothetical protein